MRKIIFVSVLALSAFGIVQARAEVPADKLVAKQIAQAEKAVERAQAKLEKVTACKVDPAPCVEAELKKLNKSKDRIAKLIEAID